MDALELARWQFAITTVYHFLFVPITIGLSAVVAGYHTAWLRTGNTQHLRVAKFLGKLFTINFALGLVTGIVQEFQFGMNWSDYSRFVGDIFGAPLAIEALLAFFLESTFLGLWIFGWGRLPKKLHAATIWLVHIGTVLSAYFILAANSFMQNPVGYKYNPTTHRAELTDFVAVLTNKVQLVTFPHVIASSYMVGGAVVMGVMLWNLRKRTLAAEAIKGETLEGRSDGSTGATKLASTSDDLTMYRKGSRVGAIVLLVSSLFVVITGDLQGKVMTEVQPMKMAAAEALYETQEKDAPFSIFTVGTRDGKQEKFAVTVPNLLSFLATGDFHGKVEGINNLEESQKAKYSGNELTAADTYAPNIMWSYWSFRWMMGWGAISMLIACWVLWLTRKGRNATNRWMGPAALVGALSPVAAMSIGWIFTEIGRQPWIVNGLMTTKQGVSPSVTSGEVLASMIVFTLLYGALAVVEVKLFMDYMKKGAEPVASDGEDLPGGHDDGHGSAGSDDDELAFAY